MAKNERFPPRESWKLTDTRVSSNRVQLREEKQRRREHERKQEEEMNRLNTAIEDQIADLERRTRTILQYGLAFGPTYFESSYEEVLSRLVNLTSGIPPHPGLPPIPPDAPPPPRKPSPPDPDAFRALIPRPSILELTFGWGATRRVEKTYRVKEQYRQAVQRFKSDYGAYKRAYRDYLAQLERQSPEFKAKRDAYEFHLLRHQDAVDNLSENLKQGAASLVEQFFSISLGLLPTPSMLKQRRPQFQFTQSTGELIVDELMPSLPDIMPSVFRYKYVKAQDIIEPVKEPSRAERTRFAEVYRQIIAGIALRTIHEIYCCDTLNLVRTVIWNGRIKDISLATGQPIEPCILSVQVPLKRYKELNLQRVDVVECVNYLGARTSFDYPNTEPVKEYGTISELHRASGASAGKLIDLETIDPTEFELLIGELLKKMGFRVEVTPPIKDGGIDVIAYDDRPLSRGKIVVQVKRYQGVVGVAEVRALRGLLIEANAMKGLLITTGRFTAGAIEAAENSLVDLVNGTELRQLLIENGFGIVGEK